jgi:HPt (histidine-containing phosphotransfer) domain-containing protein
MSSDTPETPIFDPEAIEKLRKVAGDQGSAFILEMAQLFIDETAKSVDELRKGCERADWKQVTRLSHSMKSSAATLGLMRLSSACKALEQDTKGATGSPHTAALAAAVLAEYDQAIPVLKGLS